MGKYKILVVDNFCQPTGDSNDSCHYCLSEHDTYQETLKICKNFLDNDFISIAKDCRTKDDFYSYWAFHGEKLLIYPDSKGKRDKFISEDYIEKKVKNYFKK